MRTKVTIQKVLGEDLMRFFAGVTIGKETKISLDRMAALEHSPLRAVMYVIILDNVESQVNGHLVRHHAGAYEKYVWTGRPDRGRKSDEDTLKDVCKRAYEEGTKFANKIEFELDCDRSTLEDIFSDIVEEVKWNIGRHKLGRSAFLASAQNLIDISKVRLCKKAQAPVREVWGEVKKRVLSMSPELGKYMVPKCVYRNGLCAETGCNWINTDEAKLMLEEYIVNFKK